jgi:uncharacterized protein (TIGR00725 family)
MTQIAVIGAADAKPEEYTTALAVGHMIAENKGTLICGGMGGVMEAACKGAHDKDGGTVGIVPDTGNGNSHLDIVIRNRSWSRTECARSPVC